MQWAVEEIMRHSGLQQR